jgi:hypothetical protein
MDDKVELYSIAGFCQLATRQTAGMPMSQISLATGR